MLRSFSFPVGAFRLPIRKVLIMNNDFVLLIRVTFDGDIVREYMLPEFAVSSLIYDEDNGVIYEKAWIVADDVDMGMWDRSC
jgi:hypothetical protein